MKGQAASDRLRVLHLCSYFIGSKVYAELFNHLQGRHGLSQFVYVPVRQDAHVGRNADALNQEVSVDFSRVLRLRHRIFFGTKVSAVFRDLVANHRGHIEASGLIHAHTLYSDGAVAYALRSAFGIPYVVTVRNTDVNVFYRYFLHLRPLFQRIVSAAGKVVFLSDSYRDQLLACVKDEGTRTKLEESEVVPNGLAPFWHGQRVAASEVKEFSPLRLLFVGRLDRNKNVLGLIEACEGLAAKGVPVVLDIVGDGPLSSVIARKAATRGWINQVGSVHSKERLADHYRRAHALVVPSFSESFGLVYGEALTQGTPVIFSRGQGFEGWFPDGHCGYGVDPRSTSDLMEKIVLVQKNHGSLSMNAPLAARRFDWRDVSQRHAALYYEAALKPS